MTTRKSRSEAYAYLSSLKSDGYETTSSLDSKDNLNITAERKTEKSTVRYVIVHTNNGWLKLTKYVNGTKSKDKRR